MKNFLKLFVLMSAFLLIVSLNGLYASSDKSSGLSEKHSNIKSQMGMSSLSGKVVESMDSGGYTYVSIEKDGKKTWVAVPKMKVTAGQEISFVPGMPMSNFKSKSLNHTFETIIFSSGVAGKDEAEAFYKSTAHQQAKAASAKPVKVEKAVGPDAYTVSELYEKSAELDKKGVVLKGQVVKFSANIMKKNWIHLQDGSGKPAEGTNDILVTSQDVLSVGDVVTLKGTLYKDKDFGNGYKYAVIIEEASVKK